jgi:GT2 family glycosyltransferase
VIVSVVIPTWRRADWLRRCLDEVSRQTRLPDEVIVVGRSEDQPAKQLVAQPGAWPSLQQVRWLEVEAGGHIAPVRAGLEAASGEVVAFLDDDTEPEPGWLQSLLEPFDDPKVGCVGGRVLNPGPAPRPSPDAGRISWYGRYMGNIGTRDDPRPVDLDGAMEGNSAWRASLLRKIGFDPVLDHDDATMYGLDLCLRARSLGYRVVYQPAARILHHSAPREAGLDRADRPRRVAAYSRNYTYIALKHLQGPRRLMFVVWWWLVGERGSYGVATGLYDLVRHRGSGPVIAASFGGKWQGVTEWRSR